ncbi:MAG: undecaprenyl-phosphate galactose phosphotransferase WbaP [Acidobacteria bacterium]|nr:undecaprenyl-phosphate galactose phosphotransferase WbaP [Acidobacteriota bacterium]
MTEIKEHVRKWTGAVLLMAIDLLVYVFSLGLAHWVRIALNGVVTVQFKIPFHYYVVLWWIPLIYLAIYLYEGLYTRRSPYWDEVGRLIRADFIGTWAVFAILTLLKISEQYSRLLLVLMGMFLVLLHPLVRLWGKRLLFYSGIWREKVAIWGVGPLAVSVAEALTSDKHMGVEVVGFIAPHALHKATVEAHDGRSFPILGTLEQAIQSMAIFRTTEIAFAEEDMGHEEATARLNDLIRYFHNVLVVPSSLKIPVLNTESLHLFREQMIVLKIKNNLLSPINRLIKRAFDLTLTLLASPIFLFLYLILIVLIRFESKGAAIYSQERIGRRGKQFKLYKFRSMYLNNKEILEKYLKENPGAGAEWEQYKKIHGKDPRVTKIGQFIRKTSLDELPQFLNVLKGNMSLVGPRPYLPDEKVEMGDKFSMIVETRPGISGLWQISGRSNLDFGERLRLDEWYVSNWTLWLDVEILIKTIGVVLKRDGAY